VKRAFTFKLSNMLGTPNKNAGMKPAFSFAKFFVPEINTD
jgi:hypothetical protein